MTSDEQKDLLGYMYPPMPSREPASITETFAPSPAPSPTTVTTTTTSLPDTRVEAKTKPKSRRINPDAIPVLATAVALVSLLMVTSFAVSFSGIYDVSAWTGLPTFLQWLPAVFIDAAILAYTISLVVFKARGESTWRTLTGLTAFAAVSVVANIAHTLSFWNGSLVDFRAWIGVLITAAAPVAVLLASEEITRLAFEQPTEK